MRYVMMASAAAAAMCASAMPVQAQTGAQQHKIDLPEQDVAQAVSALARQTGAQIVIAADAAQGRRIRAVRGRYTVAQALERMLNRTGLRWGQTGDNAFAIVPQAEVSEANALDGVPEILVNASKAKWSLNTGIERTQNDSQPFQVFDQAAIKRSGAVDLEGFLASQVSANVSPTSSDQTGTFHAARSEINLRGLGTRETLILVDGRRMPSVNLAGGGSDGDTAGQPSITGIPLAAIERIEVLPSSASGIYGQGASGGVINIILRHDYHGFDMTAGIGGTYNGGGFERRLSMTGAIPLEGGRTTLNITASLRKTDPVYNRQRESMLVKARRAALANNPNYFSGAAPLGSTANIQTGDGTNLVLKPAYGGTDVGSSYTHAPAGYAGLASGGVAGLVANAGSYALDSSATAGNYGGNAMLVAGTEQGALSLSVRREMNDRLTLYAEAGANYSLARKTQSLGPSSITLSADAPNNPFTSDVRVVTGWPGADVSSRSENRQYRALMGAIVTLPFEWHGNIDITRARNVATGSNTPPGFDAALLTALGNGAVDVLADPATRNAGTYSYLAAPFGVLGGAARTDQFNLVTKLAGPLPIALPGGRPVVTLNFEHNSEVLGPTVNGQIGTDLSNLTYTARRSETMDALYFELTAPLFGAGHTLPLVQELTITAAGRWERYSGSGAPVYTCLTTFGPATAQDVAQCPGDATIESATTHNSHIDPTISAKWVPARGIMLRGSFATGYVPPQLNQLVRQPMLIYTDATDPQRGNEHIGTYIPDYGIWAVEGYTGGNANLKPETSRTITAGVVLQPLFASGLRLSADWTRIRKRNNYYNPQDIAYTGGVDSLQQVFAAFMAAQPQRFTRGTASDGYSVGPVTGIDLSWANLTGTINESWDFAGDYAFRALGGRLELNARATLVTKLAVEVQPGQPWLDYTGVINNEFVYGSSGFGSLRWKGSGGVRWSNSKLALGWQTRYFGSYYLNLDRTVNTNQGSAKVAAQIYHDISFSYNLPRGITVRGGVNNVFNTRPPLDTSQSSILYSKFGDPRLATWYLNLSKSF